MGKFKVGDKVKVIAPLFSRELGVCATGFDDKEATYKNHVAIGHVGEVADVSNHMPIGTGYFLKGLPEGDSPGWYHENALEHG